MKARLGMAAALLALCTGTALAQSSLWEAVWRSEEAAKTSMVGRVRTMTLEGQRTATARVRAAKGKLRLDYQAGRHRWSLIDNGRELIILQPRSQEAVVHPRPSLAVDRKLAERNYEARVVGEGRIAGRGVQLVAIVPRGGDKATLKLWLDRETGFALKRERYNVEGNLTTGTEYLEVEFGASVPGEAFLIPETWRRMPVDGRGPRLTMAQLARQMGFKVREPKYMPSGYVLTGCYVQEWGRHGNRMAELRYTDGLRVLSVFEREKGEWMEAGEERGRRGGGRGRGAERERGAGGGGGRGRGEGRGGGRGEGRGRGGGFGFGPPGREDMTLVDRGTEKALRYLGDKLVVVVVGDLTKDEIVRVARSVE